MRMKFITNLVVENLSSGFTKVYHCRMSVARKTNYSFTFTSLDYGVFIFVLSISTAIGVYFGYCGKAKTTDDYLLGGKRMQTIPIAISLVASQLSAMSIIAIPAEMYSYGIDLGLMVPAIFGVVLILSFIVIPVFYKNNLSNCYEYLELRFNKQTRQLVTVSFLLTVFLTIPVFMFIPSLAFSQVTSLNIHLINSIICGVCVFYTMLGGIKAVVWTDVVQAAIMLGSCILIVGLGIYEVGGVREVFTRAFNGGRLDINMNLNLVDRTSFWNCFFGSMVIWTGYVGLNQSCVQRLIALPTLSEAKRSLAIFCIGFFLIMSLNCLTGIIMFAKYFRCDPVKLEIVDKADKLMPFFVQDIVGHLKGMPGIFISCVFSAALSTISANLNSVSGVIYFDYIKPYVKHTEPQANFYMKILVTLIGVYSVLGGFVVEKFSSILQIVITICGITQGAVVGVFTLGMLYPKAHGKSAFISTLLSVVIMGWIVIGSQILISTGELKYDPLPTRIDDCSQFNSTNSMNSTLTSRKHTPNTKDGNHFSVYKTSFNWFIIFGAILVWIVGIPLSHMMKDGENKFNTSLISPLARGLLRKELRHDELPQQDELKHFESGK